MNLSLPTIILMTIGLGYMFAVIGIIIHIIVTGKEEPFTRRPPD